MEAADIAEIQGAISSIINDRPVSIDIVREGEATGLEAQTVRLAKQRSRGSNTRISEAGAQVVADYLVLGAVDLDIQRGDRFVLDGRAFEVIFVETSSLVKRTAEVVLRD